MTGLTLVTTGEVEDPKEMTPRERWQAELEASDKAVREFEKRAAEANKRFLDERDTTTQDARWFNIYHANTEILAAALYSDIPEPCVSRRYDDYKDDVGRVAALILQRSIKQDINDPEDQFNTVMDNAVQDRLIAGMACAWLRFETETAAIPTSEGGTLTNFAQSTQPHATQGGQHTDGFDVPGQDIGGAPLQKIVDQSVIVDYVHWRDFRFSPCRTWEERRWVARRVFMTRAQLTKRFGAGKAKLCTLDYSDLKDPTTGDRVSEIGKQVFKKAVVWEIWDREERKVHWYAPGYADHLLDSRDDFLKLQSFEPCPKPMLANVTTSGCVPRPDYYIIQDQYEELNSVNARIALLVQACKVVGVYDQAAEGVKSMLKGNENTMIPVPNWSQFSEKGGMKGSVDWLPLDQVVAALERLNQAREVIKGQIYELTGIADIVRGDSKASETLGAQKIKAQFASIRIKKLQKETAAFASDILRIKGEMSAKHYEPATLIRRSGIVYTDNDMWVVDAIALLKSEQGFNWRIVVQSDTMAQADYEGEKEDRIKFASAVTGYITQAFPIAGQIPEMKPVIIGLLKWMMAAFKGSDDITGMLDKQLSALEGKPPPPPKPDPAEIKAQTEQQRMQGEMQMAQQAGQQKLQEGQQKMALEQQKAQLEQQRQEAEMAFEQQKAQLEREKMQMELEFKKQELALKSQEHQQSLQATVQKSQIDLESHQQLAAQKAQDAMVQSEQQRAAGEQQLEMSREEHEQGMAQSKAQGDQDLQIAKSAAAQRKPQE